MTPYSRFAALFLLCCAARAEAQQAAPAKPVRHADPALAHTMPTTGQGKLADAPRASWAPEDEADSLWKAAREALNRTEYRVAARLFRELRDKHPKSRYVGDASYWEAFSLYRIGTTEDLRAALAVLRAAESSRFSQDRTRADAVTLATRINGALAQRGDPDARAQIQSTATGQLECDEEQMQVRVEALSALSQMDDASALPLLRRVLARRDSCTAGLRRRAVYLLIRNNAQTSAPPILVDVVQNDPEMEVRLEAVQALARLAALPEGKAASDALEQILRTSSEPKVQAYAVRSLASVGQWSAMRGFVERAESPLALRIAAISGFNPERSTPEDVAWLRGLYPRVAEADLKEAVVSAIGRVGGEANEQWLVALARNTSEPVSVRTTAISRLSRSKVPVADFIRIYDAASERQVREYVLRVLAERKEPEAVDKLIEVARTGTDPVLRRSAIHHLSRHKSDPRVRKLFEDLVG